MQSWYSSVRVRRRVGVGSTGHLAVVVDDGGICVGTSQRAQVSHDAFLPQKRPRLRTPVEQCEGITFPVGGDADDLAPVIDVARQAFVPSKRPKFAVLPAFLHRAAAASRYPKKGFYPAVLGEPGDRTGIIAPDREAVDTARQRAEIPERPSPPAKCVKDETLRIAGIGSGGIREPDNHPCVIDEGKFLGLRAIGAAESPPVDKPVAKAISWRCRLLRRGGAGRERGRRHDRYGDDRRNLGSPSSGRCSADQELPHGNPPNGASNWACSL